MAKTKGKSTSKVKLSNKSANKKAKGTRKHKLNKEIFRKKELNLPQSSKNQKNANKKRLDYTHKVQEDEFSEVDLSDEETKQFLNESGNNLSVLSTSLLGKGRHSWKTDSFEEEYEKVPRKLSKVSDSNFGNKVALLPIKEEKGKIITRCRDYEVEPTEEVENLIVEKEEVTSVIDNNKELSLIEFLAKRKQELHEKKLQVASISQSILEDPEKQIGSLKQLLLLTSKQQPLQIRKLSLLSLLEIFQDIIPSYRIRELSETEKSEKVKADVRNLRHFEECLLSNYQTYLQLLEDLVRDAVKFSKKRTKQVDQQFETRYKATCSLAIIAAKAFSELIKKNNHFNYRNNIIAVIVPKMELVGDLKEIGNIFFETIKFLFKTDNTGELSLEIVKVIHKLVKAKVTKAIVLETFLHLRINIEAVRIAEQKGNKIERLKEKKEKIRQMSRKEKKRKKIENKLNAELQEAEAIESHDRIEKYHTELIKLVFVTYFRILKMEQPNKAVLSVVLRGLSRLAHCISVDFFDDLMAVLKKIMEKEELGLNERLNCINTSLKILSGQGEVLVIDPRQFYIELYNLLILMAANTDSINFKILKDCLINVLIHRRKQVAIPQVTGYFKRMTTILLQLGSNQIIEFLIIVRNILQLHKKCDYLLDNESFGSGVFQPDAIDPEHSNADSTALWELSLSINHYHPNLEIFSRHILNGAPSQGNGSLPSSLLKKDDIQEDSNVDDISNYFHDSILEKRQTKKLPTKQDTFISEKFIKYLDSVSNSSNGKMDEYFPDFVMSNTIS